MAKPIYSAWTVLESSGANTVTQTFTSKTTTDITGLSGEHAIEIYIETGWDGAPLEGESLEVYLRPINVDATTDDTAAPATDYAQHLAGSVLVDPATTVTTNLFPLIPVSQVDYEVYFYNRTSNTMSYTWNSKYRTVTF